MHIILHKNFEKKYKKLRDSEKRKFKERKKIFLENQFHPQLNNHSLTGKYEGSRSINVTGDIRAIYRLIDENTALFYEIDSHSNLYS